jgi:hypothetical protein
VYVISLLLCCAVLYYYEHSGGKEGTVNMKMAKKQQQIYEQNIFTSQLSTNTPIHTDFLLHDNVCYSPFLFHDASLSKADSSLSIMLGWPVTSKDCYYVECYCVISCCCYVLFVNMLLCYHVILLLCYYIDVLMSLSKGKKLNTKS